MYVMYIFIFTYILCCFVYIMHKHVSMSLVNETMAPDRFVADVELTLPMELGSWASTEHPLSALGNLTWITWKKPVVKEKNAAKTISCWVPF